MYTLYPRYLWYTLSLYMYRMYGYGHVGVVRTWCTRYGHVVVVGMVHVTVYHVHGGVYLLWWCVLVVCTYCGGVCSGDTCM